MIYSNIQESTYYSLLFIWKSEWLALMSFTTSQATYLVESWGEPGIAEHTTPTHTARIHIPFMLLSASYSATQQVVSFGRDSKLMSGLWSSCHLYLCVTKSHLLSHPEAPRGLDSHARPHSLSHMHIHTPTHILCHTSIHAPISHSASLSLHWSWSHPHALNTFAQREASHLSIHRLTIPSPAQSTVRLSGVIVSILSSKHILNVRKEACAVHTKHVTSKHGFTIAFWGYNLNIVCLLRIFLMTLPFLAMNRWHHVLSNYASYVTNSYDLSITLRTQKATEWQQGVAGALNWDKMCSDQSPK